MDLDFASRTGQDSSSPCSPLILWNQLIALGSMMFLYVFLTVLLSRVQSLFPNPDVFFFRLPLQYATHRHHQNGTFVSFLHRNPPGQRRIPFSPRFLTRSLEFLFQAVSEPLSWSYCALDYLQLLCCPQTHWIVIRCTIDITLPYFLSFLRYP